VRNALCLLEAHWWTPSFLGIITPFVALCIAGFEETKCVSHNSPTVLRDDVRCPLDLLNYTGSCVIYHP